jgi:outer membrane receptor protein involved in Fe transport
MGNPNERYLFDIPQGVAAWRLNDFGTQSGMQLLFNFEDMKGVSVAAVHGEYKPFDALNLMIKGTDIHYEFVNRRTVTLTRSGTRMWSGKVAPEKPASSKSGSRDRRSSEAGLEQVTVSAIHDSTLSQIGSAVLTMSRADIDATGFVTAQGVVRTLPQVFGGGPTEDTFLASTEARTNVTRGSGINLRGLGAASTLVLMNGRRLPGSGSEGLYVDVSNLPLAAVERIDILPDSSSTFFGSDAVGGVVNFVMRDDFTGGQTEAYFGDSTRGGLNENYISQLVGTRTETGRGMLALDFYSRDNLPASERRLAHSDLRTFGGSNFDIVQSNPGNILLGGSTWAIPHDQDGTALEPGDFAQNVPNLQDQYKGADILPSQQRWTGFGTWRQEVTERFSIFADALIGQRDVRGRGAGALGSFTVPTTNAFYTSPLPLQARVPLPMRYNFYEDLGSQTSDARVQSADLTTGFELGFGRWHATATLGYASEKIRSLVLNQVNAAALNAALARSDRESAFNPFGDGSFTKRATLDEIRGYTHAAYRSDIQSGSLLLSGPIAEQPGGEVTLSFGGDARKQDFRSTLQTNTGLVPTDMRTDRDRSIRSGFGELRVPIVGDANRFRGAEALMISAAERYENYSDFGHSAATRFGLTWVPVRGIAIRSSYSESFRPPGLLDLDESNNVYLYANQLVDPRTGKPTTVLIWGGKNRDLKEETARSWTAGLEIEPPGNPDSGLALTYFSTNFTNRLNTPAFTPDLLSNPDLSPLVTRDPSADYRAQVCNRARQSGVGTISCLAVPVTAIIDLRSRNDAIVHTQGFDLLARYDLSTHAGLFNFALNGTYITNFAEAKAAYQPLINAVSTQNHPINLKLRGSMRWRYGAFDVSAYTNYFNHYKDVLSTPHRSIASWTTFDLHAAYTFSQHGEGWLGNTTLALGAENLFDRDPPFVNNAVASIGYDQENGDLTGRTVSLTVRKSW